MRKLIIAAAAATALVSSVAMASVTFDPVTATGFVGKGDVQLAFGWNNKAAQDNARAVSFSYNTSSTYDVTCEWDTVTGGPKSKTIHHDITIPKHTSVLSSVLYDARLKNQYTGYSLNGLGASTTSGQATPSLGDNCPGNNPGLVTDVVETSSSAGLWVKFNESSIQIQ